MKVLAKNFLLQIDRYLDSDKDREIEHTPLPSLVSFMPYSTLRLRGRNANRVVRPFLKVMHKATGKFYIAQQEENQRLQEKIDDLEFRLQKIETHDEA